MIKGLFEEMIKLFNGVFKETSFLNIIMFVNFIISTLFVIIYFHHNIFLIVGTFAKKKKYPAAKINHKYAYLICGRNEEKVIGNLLDSINNQEYPKELITIFVCADNCTDNTAQIAKDKGAIVYERFNNELIGKSYGLEELVDYILKNYPDQFEAFIVFDADNLLEKDYTFQMNKAFDAGNEICTSYRMSKNYGQNWVSAGSGLLFYREARLVHRTRATLKSGTYVSGTGFLVSNNILKKNGGWKHHLLVEDIEFSIDMTLHGYKVAFVEEARFFDEQPTKFIDSWNQRLRWCKGTHQCFAKYEWKLLKLWLKKSSFTAYDLLTHILPFPMILFLWSILYTLIIGIYAMVIRQPDSLDIFLKCGLNPFLGSIFVGSIYVFIQGAITTIVSWKDIYEKWYIKVIFMFTFPLFMLGYLPITTISAFKKVKWKPVSHSNSLTLQDIEEKQIIHK